MKLNPMFKGILIACGFVTAGMLLFFFLGWYALLFNLFIVWGIKQEVDEVWQKK